MSNVIVVIGAGSIGRAVPRRVSAGKHVLLANLRHENSEAAANVLSDAGFEVSTATVDVSARESVHALVEKATANGAVTGVIHAAGASPTQASVSTILNVDLHGTALVLEEFGKVVAPGGAGVVIASQSGHRLPALTPDENRALATTPADLPLPRRFLTASSLKVESYRRRVRTEDSFKGLIMHGCPILRPPSRRNLKIDGSTPRITPRVPSRRPCKSRVLGLDLRAGARRSN